MSRTRITDLIVTIEKEIGQHGLLNHEYHKSTLLPQLVTMIGQISLKDFGSYEIPRNVSSPTHPPPIIWSDIYTCPQNTYTINLFRMFKNTSMPLHDHPSISGINYLLSGNIQHSSFERIEKLNDDKNSSFYVCKKYPMQYKSQSESILTYANEENIHTFDILENTSILQILIPDYNGKERKCSYWKVINDDSIFRNDESRVLLEMMAGEFEGKTDANVPFDGVA